MRGSRKPTPQKKPEASAGSKLRDALAKKIAADQIPAQSEEERLHEGFCEYLSDWFNAVAANVPKKVEHITLSLECYHDIATDFSYSAADDISLLRDVGSVELETLAGFQALDRTCRHLDVECTVSSGRHGYGRTSTAGQQYLHVNVDAAKPYRPVTVEKPAPRGPRPFR